MQLDTCSKVDSHNWSTGFTFIVQWSLLLFHWKFKTVVHAIYIEKGVLIWLDWLVPPTWANFCIHIHESVLKGSEKNSCILMHLSLFQIGYLSFPIGQLLSKVFEHGWDKLVAGCLKHIQVQKIQYRPVLGLCKGVFLTILDILGLYTHNGWILKIAQGWRMVIHLEIEAYLLGYQNLQRKKL